MFGANNVPLINFEKCRTILIIDQNEIRETTVTFLTDIKVKISK